MNRDDAFELLKFLEDNYYLAGSLTAEQLIEVLDLEELTPEWGKSK